MRIIVSALLIFVSLSSCLSSDKETELIRSPSGRYLIKATVNRIDNSKENYAKVVIHIYNRQKKLLDFNSHASDVQKWVLGWTTAGDTIMLQSSDIGDRAWVFDDNKLKEIEMTGALFSRAAELKAEKYW